MTHKLDRVYGQNHIVSFLEECVKSNLFSHALLFTGQNGTGKFNAAVEFSKSINSSGESENIQKLLDKISSLKEPYIKYIFPLPRGKGESNTDGPFDKLSSEILELISTETERKSRNSFYRFTIPGSNNIKISSIRDIKKNISFDFSDIRYKIIIIEDAHLMSDEAQNALLKSLEEPPAGVIFILLTPHADRLLPTIRSRCWHFKFKPLSEDILTNILIDNFNIDKNLAKRVAPFSDGSVNNALEMIANDFDYLLDKTITILRYSLGRRYHTAIRAIYEILENESFLAFYQVLRLISIWLNDVMKNRKKINISTYIDYVDTLEKFNARFTEADVVKINQSLNELISASEKNVNLNLIATNIIFEIASIALR